MNILAYLRTYINFPKMGDNPVSFSALPQIRVYMQSGEFYLA